MDELYHQVFTNNPLPMWIYDAETLRFLDVNDAAVEHYGWARHEFLQLSITDIRPLEDTAALTEYLKTIPPRLAYAGAWRHRRKDGTIIDVEITSHDLDFRGRKARLVQSRDVTERRRAEAAQRESQGFTQRLTDTIPALMYIYDLSENRPVYYNAEFQPLLGYTPEEMRAAASDAIRWLVHPDDAAGLPELRRRLRIVGATGTVENTFRLRHKSGEWRWFQSRAVVFLRGVDGVPRQILGVAIDITHRRELEEQLRQSQKLEAIGKLAGGIAHDFNNLLTAIGGFAELALDELDTASPARESLEEIGKVTQRATALTQQLLAFGRKQPMQPKVLDLNAVVESTGRMLERLLGEGIALEMRLEAAPATVRADPGLLEQVLVNLAVNARDAMPDGGRICFATSNAAIGPAEAGAYADLEPGDYVRMTVRDTGVGMDPAVRARIFEPFFTTKEKGKGTGLGLATVYGIVKQSGGHVAVRSAPGEGAIFTVYLPRVAEPRKAPGD